MTTSGQSVPDTALSERQCWLFGGIPFTRTRYVLDGNTLKQVKGILSPVVKSVNLSQIRTIAAQCTSLQKRFGLSTIQVATDDPLVSELVIRNIRRGAVFEGTLRRRVEEAHIGLSQTV